LATSLVFWASKASAATGYIDVEVAQAKTMIDSNPSLVVLDVRNQSEYVTGHIRNAKLFPLFQLSSNLSQLNPSDEILVYCKAGGRSTQASQILVSNGFLHIYNMHKGIDDWIGKEYPVYVKYASIQEAINSAMDGSSLYVGAGEYSELLVLNKSLNLIGENKDTTIINGMSTGTVLRIGTDNASVSDLKLEYSACSCSEYYGIEIESNHLNINITNNNIFSDSIGILINRAQNIAIERNNVTNSRDYPIAIRDSTV
jgi:adenylyltransferase/sulfurtransferase